jgi:Flp pilus assembly protein TadD
MPNRDSPGWLAPALLVLAALAAYGNSFAGPFVLDDVSSIAGNPSLRHLWPLPGPLSPPAGLGLTVEGRPMLNLSLALNYAISGLNPWSYHALNLLIHLVGGLTLFGVIRRTLVRLAGRARQAEFIALVSSVLWIVHPLQTESVTYVVQRAEALMGLWYLLTLYCFIRYSEPPLPLGREATPPGKGQAFWAVLAVAACLLGMASKEVMVSAPVIVFLYDRTFVSGTFRTAWRRHRRLYVGLAGTWVLLGELVFRTGSRGGTSGFGVGVNPVSYWLTQFPAVARYLRLAFWPEPLVFDYGTPWVRGLGEVLPAALVVTALGAGTLWAFFCPAPSGIGAAPATGRRAIGFAGAWFFAVLAPTSLVPGNRQTLAEHRMYLALAPLIAVAVASLVEVTRRKAEAVFAGWRAALGCCLAAVAVGFTGLTLRRNLDYQSALRLFADTAAKGPGNPFAQANLGMALLAHARPAAAVGCFEAALRLQPNYPIAENDLGNALLELGAASEAVAHYRAALRLNPAFADAHNNLGSALMRLHQIPEAAAEFETALRLQPNDAEAHNNLGSVWAGADRLAEAIPQFQAALRLAPDYMAARANLAKALRQFRSAANPAVP